MVTETLRLQLLEAYSRFGERLLMVLRAATSITKERKIRGEPGLGDFDHRSLAERLRAYGLNYNPSLLLRALERDYGIIETSYKSSTQHWYRFKVEPEALEQLLRYFEGAAQSLEEPEVALLKVQLKSLQPNFWLRKLKELAVKPRLSESDRRMFQRFSFNELPRLVRILKRAEAYEDALYAETSLIKELLSLAHLVSERLNEVQVERALGSRLVERPQIYWEGEHTIQEGP